MKNKKILIITGAVVIVVISAVILMLTSLNRIVAAAIERYGSVATQTHVSVSSVNIRLAAGEGSINGLVISNPSGFTGPAAFRLGSISTKIDTSSTSREQVSIDTLTISGPRIIYEINESGKSNIDIIKQNIRRFQKQSVTEKEEPRIKNADKRIKLKIRRVVIESGNIDVRIAALSDKALSASLPRIELSNIGGKNGTSPGEVGAHILSALTKEASSAASKLGVDMYLGKTLDEISKGLSGGGDMLKESAEGAGAAIKKLFGK